MNEFSKKQLEGLKSILLHARECYPAMHKDKDCTELLNQIKRMLDGGHYEYKQIDGNGYENGYTTKDSNRW